jgi:hypothetical protein
MTGTQRNGELESSRGISLERRGLRREALFRRRLRYPAHGTICDPGAPHFPNHVAQHRSSN